MLFIQPFFSYIWNDFILFTFSYDISDIHVILSSTMDGIWMKTYNAKPLSTFLLSRHHLLVKCTTKIWLQHFTHKIWSNIQLLYSITSRLKHLIIDFLVVNDKISFSVDVTRICHPNMIPYDFSATFDDLIIVLLSK